MKILRFFLAGLLLSGLGLVLILAPKLRAQSGPPASQWVIQFQNAGTPILNRAGGFLPINCSTGVTCTYTGGVVVITTSGAGSTSFANVTPGTNTGALVIGSGGSLGQTGSGALNGVVTGNSTETVQQAMTATSGGMALAPANSAASDNPLGTQVNSINTPSSSSQTAHTALIDYRYGGSILSLFNPGPNQGNPSNVAWPTGVIGNFTVLPSATLEYNEWLTGIQLNAYDGGTNFNQPGIYTNKTSWDPFVAILNGWTQGQHIAGGFTCNGYGAGDCLALNETAQGWGGSNTNSDEGIHLGDKSVMGGNVAFVGNTASGGTAGSTAIVVTGGLGSGTQGSGRSLLDTTTGTSLTITTLAGSGPLTYTASGTPFTTSTSTTDSTAITTPGSTTISVSSTSGITANSTLVVIYTSASAECFIPTAIVANTSITGVFRKTYTTGATLAWGGQVCNYVSLAADSWTTTGAIAFTNVLNTLRQALLVVGSPTTSTLTVWNSVSGGYAGAYVGNAVTSAGSNAATLYQGAEVLSVQANGTTCNTTSTACTFTLAPNNLTFGTDAVEEPLGPNLHMTLSNTEVFVPFVGDRPAFGGGYTVDGNIGYGDDLWNVTDKVAFGLYATHGGNETPPLAGYTFSGLVRNGFYSVDFPDSALLAAGCPINSSATYDCTLNNDDSYKVIAVTAHTANDYISHNPDLGDWRVVGGSATVGWLFNGATGAFLAQNGGLGSGADNSVAGTLTLSNGSAAAHTIFSSAATTTNTIAGFATVPTTAHIVTCTTSSTTCTLTDGGATVASLAPLVSPSFTTPALGAATASSVLATGIVDGTAPVTVTTGTTGTPGATYNSGYTFNQEATAATGVTYTLPATATGKQYCVFNSIVSGTGAPDTGVLTVYPPASSYIILNGVINTIGGGGTHGVASGGAAADAACFVAIDATHWNVNVLKGTWTAN